MAFQDLVTASKKYFPSLKIRYKDQSPLMKVLGKILIFNPNFMTSYATTIGNTVYFPSAHYVRLRPVSASIVLMHELVHMYDEKKWTGPLFALGYLFPQILCPIFLALCFLVSWKIMIPLALLSLLPIPSYFRMIFEKRAYESSLYIMQVFGNRMKFNPHLKTQKGLFLRCFKDSSYYYMWPFNDPDKQFDLVVDKAQAGKRPFKSPVFDMLDDLSTNV